MHFYSLLTCNICVWLVFFMQHLFTHYNFVFPTVFKMPCLSVENQLLVINIWFWTATTNISLHFNLYGELSAARWSVCKIKTWKTNSSVIWYSIQSFIVQTIGYASKISPVWTDLAKMPMVPLFFLCKPKCVSCYILWQQSTSLNIKLLAAVWRIAHLTSSLAK